LGLDHSTLPFSQRCTDAEHVILVVPQLDATREADVAVSPLHHAADIACRGRLMDLGDLAALQTWPDHRCVGVALPMQAGAGKDVSMQKDVGAR
jgi:hypothetical protein